MAIQINSLPSSIEEIPLEEYNPLVINSIASRYAKERQKSKAPTFALT